MGNLFSNQPNQAQQDSKTAKQQDSENSSNASPQSQPVQYRQKDHDRNAPHRRPASDAPTSQQNPGRQGGGRPKSENPEQLKREKTELALTEIYSKLTYNVDLALKPSAVIGDTALYPAIKGMGDFLQKEMGNRKIQLDKKILEEHHARDKRLQELETKIRQEQSRKKQLLNRLSELAGARLKDNNPAIADLSDQNRPSKISERYSELYDNEWTDVMEAIKAAEEKTHTKKQRKNTDDDNREENEEMKVVHFLLESLKDTYTFCKRLTFTQWDRLLQLNRYPTQIKAMVQTSENRGQDSALPDMSVEARQRTRDFQKIMALHVSKHIFKLFKESRFPDLAKRRECAPYVSFMDDSSYLEYIQTCLELCWLMRVQDPPVEMIYNDSQDYETNSKYFRSYTRTGTKIEFVVWPALLLHQNGPILYRGVAQYLKAPKRPASESPSPGVNSKEHRVSPTAEVDWQSTGTSDLTQKLVSEQTIKKDSIATTVETGNKPHNQTMNDTTGINKPTNKNEVRASTAEGHAIQLGDATTASPTETPDRISSQGNIKEDDKKSQTKLSKGNKNDNKTPGSAGVHSHLPVQTRSQSNQQSPTKGSVPSQKSETPTPELAATQTKTDGKHSRSKDKPNVTKINVTTRV